MHCHVLPRHPLGCPSGRAALVSPLHTLAVMITCAKKTAPSRGNLRSWRYTSISRGDEFDGGFFESASMIEIATFGGHLLRGDSRLYRASGMPISSLDHLKGGSPATPNFVGIPFDTIEEALAAVVKEATS
jgi:hypothetical protein